MWQFGAGSFHYLRSALQPFWLISVFFSFKKLWIWITAYVAQLRIKNVEIIEDFLVKCHKKCFRCVNDILISLCFPQYFFLYVCIYLFIHLLFFKGLGFCCPRNEQDYRIKPPVPWSLFCAEEPCHRLHCALASQAACKFWHGASHSREEASHAASGVHSSNPHARATTVCDGRRYSIESGCKLVFFQNITELNLRRIWSSRDSSLMFYINLFKVFKVNLPKFGFSSDVLAQNIFFFSNLSL